MTMQCEKCTQPNLAFLSNNLKKWQPNQCENGTMRKIYLVYLVLCYTANVMMTQTCFIVSTTFILDYVTGKMYSAKY